MSPAIAWPVPLVTARMVCEPFIASCVIATIASSPGLPGVPLLVSVLVKVVGVSPV